MKELKELVGKSAGAAILIALGNYALLKLGNPIGPVIFAFGLLGVCYMKQNLFTGKCGFLFEDKIRVLDLLIILVVNLITGFAIGLLFSKMDPVVYQNAVEKVATWHIGGSFFAKAVMCGIIMYIAVLMYRKNTPLGIIYGIPLFIFCGFQHCIANVVTLGAARTFDWSLLVCIAGNFIGSIVMWYISKDVVKEKK